MRSANGSLEFLRRISRPRRSAQRGVESISDYVEQSASLLTPEHLDEVRGELSILNLQFAAISVRQFPHLQQQSKLLTDFLEDTAADLFPDRSSRTDCHRQATRPRVRRDASADRRTHSVGCLAPVHVSEKPLTSEPRYEFFESLRAYLRYLRAQALPAGSAQPRADIAFGLKHNREKRNPK
jgi:hypothetical protein